MHVYVCAWASKCLLDISQVNGKTLIFMKLPNYRDGTQVNVRMKESHPSMLQSSHLKPVLIWVHGVFVCEVSEDVGKDSRQREGEIRADLQWITSLSGQAPRKASCLANRSYRQTKKKKLTGKHRIRGRRSVEKRNKQWNEVSNVKIHWLNKTVWYGAIKQNWVKLKEGGI